MAFEEETVLRMFGISEVGRAKYLEEAFRNNRVICMASSLFCISVESFNIIRVLFFSNSGLGTLNNRIYFGFYSFLLFCSVIYIIIARKEAKDFETENCICLIYASVVFLWNTCLNAYDILHSDRVHVIMAVSMMVCFSALVIMEPLYGLFNIWINYFIFMLTASIPLFSGVGFNYTITALMASMICIVKFRHLCIEIAQSAKIREIDEKLNERRLWLTQEQYELISQNAGFITFRWDSENDTIIFSKNWEKYFENSYEISNFHVFIEQSLLLQDQQKEKIKNCIDEVCNGSLYQNLELMLPAKNHMQYWFKIQVVRQCLSSDENVIYAVGFMNDITAEKERILDLERNVSLDSFTGLLNKASIDNYGRRWMNNLSMKDQKMAMMILDMDDFKNINDTYGHPCGDFVLKQVADILVSFAPEEAKVGRLGGDEFIVLMEFKDNATFIYEYANTVIQNVTKISWDHKNVSARCSIGFAVTTEPGWSYEKLYQCADEALYAAKKNGKNRVWEFGNK